MGDIKHQRYSTRLYILMLIICLSIIILFESRSTQSVITTITSPSEEEYQNLFKLQNRKLSCPCRNISSPYSTFISINATFHTICSSDFISDPWIAFLYGNGLWGVQTRSDIRGQGAAYFSLLSVLCSLAQAAINKEIENFLEKILINAQPLLYSDFQAQMDATIHRFFTSTTDNIARTLHMIHMYLYSSSFISAYFLNWNMWIKDIYDQSPSILTSPNELNNGTCSCATQSDCKEPAGIYAESETSPRWTIPGFYVACSAFDSLMQSTLECFYAQECISALQAYSTSIGIVVPLPRNNITFKQLDFTRPSRFQVNSSILQLVNELFVENWLTNVSYSAFYHQCSPTHCSHTMQRPSGLVYTLSRTLGLYGGLTLALRFIIPNIVRIYSIICKRCIGNERSVGQHPDPPQDMHVSNGEPIF